MKYEIDRIGAPGKIYLEKRDVINVEAAGDGVHCANLYVKSFPTYQNDDAYEWLGRGNQSLRLSLVDRQAEEIVEQEREGNLGKFCNGTDNRGCYDYGKAEKPGDCQRCQLIHACRMSKAPIDLRKIKTKAVSRPGCGYFLCMMGLVVMLWQALVAQGNSWQEVQTLKEQNAALSRRLAQVKK